jgi:cobalt-zinc-cadmium resistance protein CzcA
MIRRLVTFALTQPLFVLLGGIIFVVGGIAAFLSLPIEAFPDIADTQVQVITLFPGRAAEEVEKQVTIPVEVALAGMSGSVRTFSHTQFGLSFLILTFDDKTNPYFARQQVVERLRDADLPPGVQPTLAPLSSATGEIYRYRLRGDQFSPMDLRTLEDWVVERQLKQVPGVADVVTWGGFVKQYEVNPDLGSMKLYKVTLQQLFQALANANANAGGSYVEQGNQQFLIRGLGLFRSSEDIGNVVVDARGGTPILVRHIADITVGNVPRQGVMGQDGDDDVVTGIVLLRQGENPSIVLSAVKEKIEQLNRTALPKGVAIVPYYDRAWLIAKTLRTVFTNLVEGAMLVTFVLLLFLGNVRAAAIVAAVIPLSLLATFLGLSFVGIPANLLSLGAMDFGIIVDGAVIVVENVFRRLSEPPRPQDRQQRLARVLDAAVEVGRPTFFSMLIIIAAHIPIFTLQRQEGRIFAPMAYSVTSALVGSLLIALTLVPLLCLMFLRKELPHQDNAIVRWCKRIYQPLLDWALCRRATVLISATLVLAVSLALTPRLGTEFLPELNEGTIWLNYNMPPSISVSEAQHHLAMVRSLLRSVPEVSTVVSKTGRPEDGTDPKLINMAELFIELKPEGEWRRGMTKRKVIDEMDHLLDGLPGTDASWSQPIRDNVLESISQVDGQIVIKLFGDDPVALRQHTEAALEAIRDVRGVERAFIDRLGELPQVQIQIDRERAARYGLNVADIQDVIETGLGGKAATQIWEGEKRFGVVVRLRNAERALAQMPNILVSTAQGLYVPLSQVATFKTIGGAMNISRENGERVQAISVFIKDRDMGSVVADMKANVAASVKLPPGFSVTWSGEFENQERAMKRLAIIVPLSISLIFLLLFNAFKSLQSALLIVLNVPFALIGGIAALLLTGTPLSVSAAIGFISLFGQAVLNGVVMVAYFNQLQATGLAPLEAVRQGALVRLRTVLMTALLAMMGLLPMALSTDIGSEIQRPLAIVVIGGLISATVLVLILLPVLYLVFAQWSWADFKRHSISVGQFFRVGRDPA